MDAFARTFNPPDDQDDDGSEGEEEEADSYHRADIEDVMEQGEVGQLVEEEERRNGVRNADEDNFDEQMRALRRAVVSEKSQRNYISSSANFINWYAGKAHDQTFSGFQPLTERWLDELDQFPSADDANRKKFIKRKLTEADAENSPIKFEEFYPCKYNIQI